MKNEMSSCVTVLTDDKSRNKDVWTLLSLPIFTFATINVKVKKKFVGEDLSSQ